MSSKTSVFTLLDIGRSLQRMVSAHYHKPYWIKTEIAKLNYYDKSGHCYPDLVEKQNGQILAQMRATIWADNYQNISKQFLNLAKKPLSEGMTVLILAKVNYHPNYGFSLNIIDIDASFTLGEMAREKQESLKRLKSEGIYDLNRSMSSPKLPQRIAVISVQTSKGYQDFINIISKTYAHFNFEIELFPALLQGDKAITSIAKALESIENTKDDFDVVTIIRGGGGDVGLSCYDSFILASKVARFPLPVVTGIGHSTNETLVELVAFKNKITPTDVAYYFIAAFQNCFDELKALTNHFETKVDGMLKEKNQELLNLHKEFKTQVNTLLKTHDYELKAQKQRIKSNLPSLVLSRLDGLEQLKYRMDWLVKNKLHNQEDQLLLYFKSIQREAKSTTKQQHQELDYLSKSLDLLSPERLLKRGYTLNLLGDKIITSTTKLKTGDRLKTIFADGYAESDVVKIQTDEKN
ncbi:exodeoxyribonuclease VII large subunit [Psychroflexus tropicus]|uniref:exodeoxyribonuclease VII large subunit n=1 Tax=Psychroflexus tropicus TaxID=197345 RepID=UPI0003A84215|nr:exodeoxyribonuclease VII large subunit [Psychroflexus tropicus]